MPKHPEQTILFNVFQNGGSAMLGVAKVELPEVKFMTETLSGAGILGEIEMPTLGIPEKLSVKLNWESINPDVFDAFDMTKQQMLECYAAMQVQDQKTAIVESLSYKLVFLTAPKGISLGGLEKSKKQDADQEFELLRLEVYYDDSEKLLIDKLNTICRINGTDQLASVRINAGLNAL